MAQASHLKLCGLVRETGIFCIVAVPLLLQGIKVALETLDLCR
jgi:hypothetical protein